MWFIGVVVKLKLSWILREMEIVGRVNKKISEKETNTI
jgi:hypothetical protein